MGVALGPRGFVLNTSDLLVLEGRGRRVASLLFVHEEQMSVSDRDGTEGNSGGGVVRIDKKKRHISSCQRREAISFKWVLQG